MFELLSKIIFNDQLINRDPRMKVDIIEGLYYQPSIFQLSFIPSSGQF